MKKCVLLMSFALYATLTINSQQYVNPLERWANYNLGDLNSFTTGDEDITIGKYYQYGRNVPLASEGDVLYWANQGGPYENGSPANYRVWHIHLINSFGTTANWFATGSASDTWESIVAQTVANGAPPAGTFEGYDYTVAGYQGTNGGSPAPVGWHIPTYAEMKSLIAVVGSNDFAYATFNVNDYQETSVDILGDGVPQNYTSDYKSKDQFTVVARRFKGTPYETAFRYEYQEVDGFNTLEIRAKQSGGASIDDIAGWSAANWSDAVVRYFPVTGYRRSGSPYITATSEGFYWAGGSSKEDQAYVITFNSNRLRGSSHARSNAYAIRCVKNYEGTTAIESAKTANINVKAGDSRISVYGSSLAGQDVYIYNTVGAVVKMQKAKANTLSFDLQNGLYVVKVGDTRVKVLVK